MSRLMVLLLERTKKRLNKIPPLQSRTLRYAARLYMLSPFPDKTTCICLSSYRGLFVSVAIRIRILQYNQVRASHGGNVLTRGLTLLVPVQFLQHLMFDGRKLLQQLLRQLLRYIILKTEKSDGNCIRPI